MKEHAWKTISATLNDNVADYLEKDAQHYSTKIGAFRMPGCR